jgi:hypothetical protein
LARVWRPNCSRKDAFTPLTFAITVRAVIIPYHTVSHPCCILLLVSNRNHVTIYLLFLLLTIFQYSNILFVYIMVVYNDFRDWI